MEHFSVFFEENYYLLYCSVLLLLIFVCIVVQKIINKVKTNKISNSSNITNTKYPSLAPTENYSPIEPYEEVLENHIDQDSSKNIALSGPYGSGKSSILRTFFKNKKDRYKNRIIYISLASFCEKENADDDINNSLTDPPESSRVTLQRQLELSILQQLIYHATPHDIPQSRFKRIRHISESTIIFQCIAFLLLLFFVGTITLKPFSDFFKDCVLCLAFFQASVTLIALLFMSNLYRFFNKLSWLKINISNIELEVSQKDSASILNRHLDEIIYYFESGTVDIVIFEDLDRFESTEIFQKLREINLLLNNTRQIDRKITFIYALRDDVFRNEDRTKFFDFMIPVVPIINISNSGDKLISFFNNHNGIVKPQDSFLSEIANFVDSMRLLNSICSEYMIYQDVLNASKLPPENLFSMIVFKNLYPKDFADLHNNKGDLAEIFAKKHSLVNKTKEQIEENIQILEREIKDCENDWIKNIQEVRCLYLAYICKKYDRYYVSISGRYDSFKNIFEFTDDSLWKALYDAKNVYLKNERGYDNSYSDIFADIEKEIGEYYNRIKQIAETKNIFIEKNQREISKLKKQRNMLSTKTLAELITENQLSIEVSEASKIHFLRFVLSNGYINENYHTYISFFHEGTLTQLDNEFIISVIGQSNLPFDYKIENVENVVNKISIEHFKKKSILNFKLVEYILEQPEIKLTNQRDLLIEQLSVLDQEEISFIIQFVEYSLNAATHLFEYIGKRRHDLWNIISKEPSINSEQRELYLAILVKACFDFIDDLDLEQGITNYISSSGHICKFSEEYDCFESLKEVFGILPIKIQCIDVPQTAGETEMFMHIYKNNLYAITAENIKRLLSVLLRDKFNETKFQSANISYIYGTQESHLISYINENLASYISNTVSKFENQKDDINILVEILNDAKIGTKQRLAFLTRQNNLLDNIDQIQDKEILNLIVRNGIINISWKNVKTYFEKNAQTLTDDLITYLNIPETFKALETEKITYDSSTKENVKKMIVDILKSEKLTENAVKHLQVACPFRWTSFEINELPLERVKTLMTNNNFVLNKDNFSQIKEHGFEGHITLIEHNSSSFLSVCDELPIDEQDWKLILQSSLPIELKREIMERKHPVLLKSNEIISVMAPIVSEHYRFYWNIEILKNCASRMNNQNKGKCLLYQLKVRNFEKKDAVQLIAQLPEPFCRLAQPGTRPTLPQNDDSRFLVGLVHGWGMTSKIDDSNNNSIYVTMKYFDPIV